MTKNKTPTIAGIVTLTLRDATTMKIMSEVTVHNRFTHNGMLRLGDFDAMYGDLTMHISTSAMSDTHLIQNLNTKLPTIIHSSVQQAMKYVAGPPDCFEMVARYDQPASTRLIRVVMLADANTTTARTLTKVVLDPPCDQTSSQVLDVTYRIQFTEVQNNSTVDNRMKQSMHMWLNLDNNAYGKYKSEPLNMFNTHVPTPPNQYHHFATDTTPIVTGTYDGVLVKDRYNVRLRTINFNIPLTSSDAIGVVFRSMIFGLLEPITFQQYNSNDNQFSTSYIIPAVGTDFANTPIQPIHNHSVSAPAPFLDVDYLATGTGSLTMDGSAWSNNAYPKFMRVDIANDGDVGVARYSFRMRNLVGFDGNTYATGQSPISYIKDHVLKASLPTISGGHGLSAIDNRTQVGLDGRIVIRGDLTGITVVDITTGAFANFDATTTPAIPAVELATSAIDSAEVVWVPDRSSGLYKIDDIWGTPIITHFDNATHGIPVGGDVACYSVAIGKGDVVWAMFDGGLCKSSNGGITWDIFHETSTHPFIVSGISNDKWEKTTNIVIDVETDTHEMAVVRIGASNANRVYWWSEVDIAVLGPAGEDPRQLVCTASGGLWHWGVWDSLDVDRNRTRRLQYGSSSVIGFGAQDESKRSIRSQPMMAYDYYNSPHIMAAQDGGNFGMYSADRKFYACLANTVSNAHVVSPVPIGSGAANGLFMYAVAGTDYDNYSQLMASVTPSTTDSLNWRYSPFEEFVWDKYQWNGSSWVKGYHAPAIDTATSVTNGIRHNFDVESHTFTGRSMLDVTDSFTTSTFASVGTFVFKLIPQAKLSGDLDVTSKQIHNSTVFELNDGTNRLVLYWDDGAGSIVLQDYTTSQTMQATPIVGSTYRCVVTLNATSALLYIDGTLIGTLTLGGAVDLSNTASSIKAHIGARTHAHDYNKRYNVGWFYRGTMENVQLWNVEWDQTDVTNDMVDTSGVIGSKPSANMISRFELTQSLVGLETKTSHVGSELLVDGITTGFVDGTGTSFIASDYYTVGVVDGYLKDNATTITNKTKFSIASITTPDFSVITSAVDGTAVVPSTAGSVTELLSMNGFNSGSSISEPGGFGPGVSPNSNHGWVSGQSSSGDLSVDFTVHNSLMNNCRLGFATGTFLYYQHTAANTNFGVSFRAGTIDFIRTSTTTADITSYAAGDRFRLSRIGTTITFHRLVDGVPTLIYTSPTTSSATFGVLISIAENMDGFSDIQVTYDKPAASMAFGSVSGTSGVYDPDYLGMTGPISVQANGVDLDVTAFSTPIAFTAEPPAGTVSIDYSSGTMMFNTAEIGKTITGSATLVTTGM